MNEISIIQGDSYEATLEISGLTNVSIVDKCVFSSSYLGICKELNLSSSDEAKYILSFTAEETSKMEPSISDFDITIFFTDDSVATVIYQGKIKIFNKKNKVMCYNG